MSSVQLSRWDVGANRPRRARMNNKAPGVVVIAAESSKQDTASLLQNRLQRVVEHAGRERADALSEAGRPYLTPAIRTLRLAMVCTMAKLGRDESRPATRLGISIEKRGTIRPSSRWLRRPGRAIFSGCLDAREAGSGVRILLVLRPLLRCAKPQEQFQSANLRP